MFIQIDTTNDAFAVCSGDEIARILRKLAKDISDGKEPLWIYDINGNACGSVEW